MPRKQKLALKPRRNMPRDEPPPELADMYARCASQRPKYFRDTLGLEST